MKDISHTPELKLDHFWILTGLGTGYYYYTGLYKRFIPTPLLGGVDKLVDSLFVYLEGLPLY